jgi:hypothetical protein
LLSLSFELRMLCLMFHRSNSFPSWNRHETPAVGGCRSCKATCKVKAQKCLVWVSVDSFAITTQNPKIKTDWKINLLSVKCKVYPFERTGLGQETCNTVSYQLLYILKPRRLENGRTIPQEKSATFLGLSNPTSNLTCEKVRFISIGWC